MWHIQFGAIVPQSFWIIWQCFVFYPARSGMVILWRMCGFGSQRIHQLLRLLRFVSGADSARAWHVADFGCVLSVSRTVGNHVWWWIENVFENVPMVCPERTTWSFGVSVLSVTSVPKSWSRSRNQRIIASVPFRLRRPFCKASICKMLYHRCTQADGWSYMINKRVIITMIRDKEVGWT